MYVAFLLNSGSSYLTPLEVSRMDKYLNDWREWWYNSVMRQYAKTIIITAVSIAGIFLLLRFAGEFFIAKFSPSVETSAGKNESVSLPTGQAGGKAVIGQGAPYFDLVSLSGSRVRSADFLGNPAVLTFWSTWSSESADQIKILDDYLAKNPPAVKQLHARVIAIDSQENQGAVANFMRRGGYEIEVLIDQNGETGNNYGAQTLPTTVFIDRSGIILEIFVGTMSEQMLADKMEKILR